MKSLELKSLFRKGVLLLAATLLLCGLGAARSVTAAPAVTEITALLNPGYRIVVDGVQQNFFNSSGSPVYPLVYNGTTYLPLRAIGELMGKNVNWDEAALTVSLAGTRTAAPTVGRTAAAQQQYVAAQLRPDFTVMLDGVRRTFSNADGTYVYPLLYNGSVYLPLRAIGELMGKNVDWDGSTGTISLYGGGASGGSTVTDADSFNTGDPQTPMLPAYPAVPLEPGSTDGQTQPQMLSNDEARQAALRQVPGATLNNIVSLRLELDGVWRYKVRIYYNFYTYKLELSAYTGELLAIESEREDYFYQQAHSSHHDN